MLSITRLLLLLVVSLCLLSCSKKAFLEERTSSTLFTLKNLQDAQNMFNDETVFPESPVLGELSSDDYYIPGQYWSSVDRQYQNTYTWAADIYEGSTAIDDYDIPYQQVYRANLILKALPGITVTLAEKEQFNFVKGAAHFVRAYAFFNLVQIFAGPYALQQPGIALPLDPDINQSFKRANMQQVYNQVIGDLQIACSLLPLVAPDKALQLSRPSAFAMLARVYLAIGQYGKAGLYADSCLQRYNKLIDYNTINISSANTITLPSTEVLYNSWLMSKNLLIRGRLDKRLTIDTGLYNLYAATDLRKQIFYMVNDQRAPTLNTSYSGYNFSFSGLAVDEMYLVRAEWAARTGNITVAQNDLNKLLINRYQAGTFHAYAFSSKEEALAVILTERRKELAFRGLRWMDLKRLNQEGADIRPVRFINNKRYELLPSSLQYALPFPDEVVNTSQITQNPR